MQVCHLMNLEIYGCQGLKICQNTKSASGQLSSDLNSPCGIECKFVGRQVPRCCFTTVDVSYCQDVRDLRGHV